MQQPSWTTTFLFSMIIIIIVIFNCGRVICSSDAEDGEIKIQNQPRIQTIVLSGVLGVGDTRTVNSSIAYVYEYTFNTSSLDDEDIRVHVNTTNPSIDFPVLFVVRQEKAVISFPLPVLSNFDKKLYNVASRTLCGEVQEGITERTIFVSVSTSSKVDVSFGIKVFVEQNFIMRLNESITTDVSPLSPRFFRFVFPASQMNRFVLLEATSKDDRCMTVSVQNASCPILDQENNVQFEGYWQTMTKTAGMTLRKEDFPNGFYVVFVMHGDNSRCDKTNTNTEADYFGWSSFRTWFEGDDIPRIKNVTFIVTEKISDLEYLGAIFGTVGIFLIFYVFSFIVSCAYLCKKDTPTVFPIENEPGTSNAQSGYPVLHSSYPAAVAASTPIESETRPIFPTEEEEEVNNANMVENGAVLRAPTTSNRRNNSDVEQRRQHRPNMNNTDDEEDLDGQHWLASDDSSLDETDIDMLQDALQDKDVYRTTTALCVAALSRKNPKVLAKKANLYLWTLITVAIFYALPVVQLVFTYQNVLHSTGNQDLCYYNYLCSHPLWMLSDFNHVYSNIGYIMLGVLFLFLVLRRETIHERLVCRYPDIDQRCGIPRHYGLFYSMGLALILEGVLSACYHVCPNHSNFQFDTCFMYVNAMLLMLKIYQTRHPDINASAYMAFAGLAVVVLLGVIGVLAGNIYFWVLFTIFHVTMGLFISFQIYYLGRWRCDCGVFRRIYNTWKNDCLASPLLCLKPLYVDRMILLTIANLSNWAIAYFGIWKMNEQDFATHLLFIFMVNLFLYSNFYIIMKLTHREKITFQPAIYIILSVVGWGVSMWVFLHKSTSWSETPAKSREFNRECILLRFYDLHDVWHMISAASIFFSFMILLTLDDDLQFVPRTRIPVF